MTLSISKFIHLLSLLFPRAILRCHGWTSTTESPYLTALSAYQPPNDPKQTLKEPDNQYGRMAFWDESYRQALEQPDDHSHAKVFSWYCDWNDLKPFFKEIVPEKESRIMIPGVGNDGCLRDMFDDGYRQLTAFDYAPEGVECAKRIMDYRLQYMDDLRVADARNLPYKNSDFDAVFDKGTLDSIYLSGGSDKDLSQKHLNMTVSELARVLKSGGIVFSINAACTNAIQKAFDESNMTCDIWEQLRDGNTYMTDDGYTSNNVDATILVWKKV